MGGQQNKGTIPNETLDNNETLEDKSNDETLDDNTRCFWCAASSSNSWFNGSRPMCRGVHLVRQPLLSGPTLSPCSECGREPSPSSSSDLLQREEELLEQLQTLHRILQMGLPMEITREATQLCFKLEPLHPHHHLTGELCQLQGELYELMGEWGKAADADQTKLACRNTIISVPSRATAFTYESLGDALSHHGATRKELLQAQVAYLFFFFFFFFGLKSCF